MAIGYYRWTPRRVDRRQYYVGPWLGQYACRSHFYTTRIARVTTLESTYYHLLQTLQRETFGYFVHEADEATGLVADKTSPGSPASIAAVGLALSSYPVGVERGYLARDAAVARTLATLRFFWNSPQGPEPNATGYKGFYYHFLDMQTGRRVWQCELSTLDTALLLAGVLTVSVYFDQDTEDEQEIRSLAEALYRRVDWRWAQSEKGTVKHGWGPESGFIPYQYE